MIDRLDLHDIPDVWNRTLFDRETSRRIEQMAREIEDHDGDDPIDEQEPWT